MIYTAHAEYGFTVEVRDDLLVNGTASVVVFRDASPNREVVWTETIRIAREPGLPVMHRRASDGREVCFGGPSHGALSEAQSRASFLLEGRIAEAKDAALAAAMTIAQERRQARRAGRG